MRIFVTAGNTQVPIDRVRCITNIFTGRTGASIALEAYRRGHEVTLATSHPEVIDAVDPDPLRWRCLPYRTFDDLHAIMAGQIGASKPDAIVHCAAVSDYLSAGVFAPSQAGNCLTMHDRSAAKVKSDEPELWLKLVRAPKLVDKIRSDWKFAGVLVKFKLEVGITQEQLRAIAEKSRQHSVADWMVANTLEDARAWALIGNESGYEKVTREELPGALLDRIEVQHG
ncbi:MAG: bifunctional phosphopantothenoylcysteine decarboxylase/phosphopantothenate synthase [Planctomycetes bacterium]|nr:bifunctional phosphopantothenoylcysteine decarboxylase/phosphopantothenate synthase [Planctomycetota bacterium]